MKTFKYKSFENYKAIQIARSDHKFEFNKLSIKEVVLFEKILSKQNHKVNNIICLGSRNGTEIDYFRVIFFYNFIFRFVIIFGELKKRGFYNLFIKLFKRGRTKLKNLEKNKFNVIGNDINPRSKREDTIICSFDDFESKYYGCFDLVYSNSFDQSIYPYKSLDTWNKLLKKNGFLIIGFDENNTPNEVDPTGEITENQIITYLNHKVIYSSDNYINYKYLITQKK